MRIVILHGFTSSAVLDHQFSRDSEFTHDEYLGGNALRPDIEDADIIVGVWPPDDEAIIVKCPEGVEIETVTFPHLGRPTLNGSQTAEEFNAAIASRGWHG